jgi:hypothetical protein
MKVMKTDEQEFHLLITTEDIVTDIDQLRDPTQTKMLTKQIV